MTRLLTLAAALLMTSAAPATAQTLIGDWRNTKDTVRLRVAPCGAALCGTAIWGSDRARADAKKGSGRELVGTTLFHDLRQGSDGKWRGKAYIPDIDGTASATVIQLDDKLIRVSGCMMLGLACRTQHWHRIK